MKALIHTSQCVLKRHVPAITKAKWRSLFLKRIFAKVSTPISASLHSENLFVENAECGDRAAVSSSSMDYFDFSSFEE
jgi:hypothetical protein